VCMVQNWTFTLFYIAAELWGDVGLSLLFWGLANEITTHDEAPVIYPLFGVGANIAQVGTSFSNIGQSLRFHSRMQKRRLLL
jgi:AAA family ATP:ADP antiporter